MHQYEDDWELHDTYDCGSSSTRMVTRSQSCFNRIKNTSSDLDLFVDRDRHQPPGMPHLMAIMKGPLGSIPNTMITRSTGNYLPVSKKLCRSLEPYKSYKTAGNKSPALQKREKSAQRSKQTTVKKSSRRKSARKSRKSRRRG